jgi:hypothetical protein
MKKTPNRGMAGHESRAGETDIWLTPLPIIRSLGEFDLNPCSPVNRPWDTAKEHYTILDDGLTKDWADKRVWLNPPYSAIELWIRKMSQHLNGIALIFARTDTSWFQNFVFPFADSMFFIKNRITFLNDKGIPGPYSAGAPSVLISYGEENVNALEMLEMDGRHVYINHQPVMIVGFSPSWKDVVKVAFSRLSEEAVLEDIYKMVNIIAPDKLQKNNHYQAKVRQVLQKHFVRISKGRYSSQQSLAF